MSRLDDVSGGTTVVRVLASAWAFAGYYAFEPEDLAAEAERAVRYLKGSKEQAERAHDVLLRLVAERPA